MADPARPFALDELGRVQQRQRATEKRVAAVSRSGASQRQLLIDPAAHTVTANGVALVRSRDYGPSTIIYVPTGGMIEYAMIATGRFTAQGVGDSGYAGVGFRYRQGTGAWTEYQGKTVVDNGTAMVLSWDSVLGTSYSTRLLGAWGLWMNPPAGEMEVQIMAMADNNSGGGGGTLTAKADIQAGTKLYLQAAA